jgi:hypothetical protein
VPLAVTGEQLGDRGICIFPRRNTAPRELTHEDLLFVVGAVGVPYRDKPTHPLLAEDLYVGLVENDESVIGVRRDTGNLSLTRVWLPSNAQSAAHDRMASSPPWRCGAATGPDGTPRLRKMITRVAPSNVPTSTAFVSMKRTRLPNSHYKMLVLIDVAAECASTPRTTTSCYVVWWYAPGVAFESPEACSFKPARSKRGWNQ